MGSRAIKPAGRCLGFVTTFLLLGSADGAYGQILQTKDISPDQSTFPYKMPGDSDPAGRIKSLVVDPNNDAILYAAAEESGVWKTTTAFLSVADKGNLKWFQSSNGLRNGLTVNQYSLAVDPSAWDYLVDTGQKYSKRLLYATNDDDGRPGKPLGGLWVSTDGAASWQHVNKLCTSENDRIRAVIFSGGHPYVATACGIWTTLDSGLTAYWTQISTGDLGAVNEAFLADAGDGTFFACNNTQLYLLGGVAPSSVTLAGKCLALTAVPNPGGASKQVLVVRTAVSATGSNEMEVTVVDFSKSPATQVNLGFGPFAPVTSQTSESVGSGVAAVAAKHITPIPWRGVTSGPGVSYDVYAADGCAWFAYSSPGEVSVGAPQWQMLAKDGTGKQCHGNTTFIHADTWAMAIPSWYDTGKGTCAVFASTDGGVFFTTSSEQLGAWGAGQCATSAWIAGQTGLHVLEGQAIDAITMGSLPYSVGRSMPLAIYLPTSDNDLFVLHLGDCTIDGGCTFLPGAWGKWENFTFILGDAGQALVDPLYPEQVLVSRGEQSGKGYVAVSNPPLPGGTVVQIINSLPKGDRFDNGYLDPGQSDLAQVRTLPSELKPYSGKVTGVLAGDYLAVQDYSPVNRSVTPNTGCSANKHDHVVRNIDTSGSLADNAWASLSSFFYSCDIQKVQVAGGHLNPAVYVLMNVNETPKVTFPTGATAGQILRGMVVPASATPGTGLIPFWFPVSGFGPNPCNGKNTTWQVDDFFVNPYDANEIYATDVTDQCIVASTDGGNSWKKEVTLSRIATNYGEYRIGCNGSKNAATAADPFADACSLSWIAFDPFAPQVRTAAMLYGGIAFSRDGGKDWMALDVTDNNHFLSNNLTEPVVSAFYDGETQNLPEVASYDQVIYAALMGKGLKRVVGPLLNLVSVSFTYQSESAKSVSVVVTGSPTVELRNEGDSFQGSALIDYAAVPLVLNYYFLVTDAGGTTTKSATFTHTLTTTDITNGVVNTPKKP